MLLGIMLTVIILDSELIVIPSVVKLIVFMLSVVKLIVFMLSVVMLNVKLAYIGHLWKVKQNIFLKQDHVILRSALFQPSAVFKELISGH